MNAPAMIIHAVRYQNKVFLRNPFSAFFSLAFPTMFLLLFGTLFGRQPVEGLDGVPIAQFLTPSIVVFAVVSTSFINLCTVVAISRDEGILKRIRGTPMPPSVYLGSRVGSSVWFSLIAAAIQVAAGILLFGVRIVWPLAPAALVTLLLGISCFCALGLALAAVIPNGEAAPAVANFTAMPILFVSGVFFPLDGAPRWLQWVGNAFPVKHFNDALVDDFDPTTVGAGFDWAHLAVLALWTVAGAIVAMRFFKWEPRGAVRPRRR